MTKFFLPLLLFAGLTLQAQNPPALGQIKEADLKKDLYALADAHFRGRSAGTIDELKAAAWVAERYRSIGLLPAGDDGTYFQYFEIWREVLSKHSSIRLNGRMLRVGEDIAVARLASTRLNGQVVYLGNAAMLDTSHLDVAGKIVALEASPKGMDLEVSLPSWRYPWYTYALYGAPLVRRGATAVIFVADEEGEKDWADANANFEQGNYSLEKPSENPAMQPVPVFWVHASLKNELMKEPAFAANLQTDVYPYPSVNIVGKVEGTDAKLKSEYLLYSGHIDAHGIRDPIQGDSIYYGADDNGSVDVAMLACARAFVKSPARRSVLFVIHGAEERGLFGSRYYSSHPTVPLQSLVAVLNGDMIGRNATDTAALLGVHPPHMNSAELVNMALAANREGPKFVLDTTWDRPSHKEHWYFRSDHLPYARLGVPALMYTSLLHPDYHTPQDNAANINYPKLYKMTLWMYRTGWKVANVTRRPAPEKDFKLER